MRIFKDRLIVVTGGAGFIGSAIVRHLNDTGLDDIVIVDNLASTEKWRNLVGKRFRHIIHKNDLFTWLEGKQQQIATFIHMGACCSTVEKDADYLLNNNYLFSVKLADYAFTHGQRLIYASSAATYGDGSTGFHDDDDKLDILCPLNMYGYSKHLFDQWLKKEGMLDKAVGLKFFNVYGPNEYHKGRMASALMHLLPSALHNGVVKLFVSNDPVNYGDGDQKRDFIYVKDAARMVCAFLNNDAGGIFNIGSGVASTWNSLARALFNAIDKPERIEYIPLPDDLKGKYQNYTCADMAKTKQLLGDEATCPPLSDNIVDYVNNYLIPYKYL